MIVLINRDNVVVNMSDYIRYVRLHPVSGYVIGCEEHEATGVIVNTIQYPLIGSDVAMSSNAVRVLKIDEVPSEVIPEETIYVPTEDRFAPRYELHEAQTMKQEENKALFAKYLASHPMTWVDGKQYGITQEDQSEISLNLNQYQVAVSAGVDAPILEWHACHEECQPWSLENLTGLSLAITQVVYPIYHLMQ